MRKSKYPLDNLLKTIPLKFKICVLTVQNYQNEFRSIMNKVLITIQIL